MSPSDQPLLASEIIALGLVLHMLLVRTGSTGCSVKVPRQPSLTISHQLGVAIIDCLHICIKGVFSFPPHSSIYVTFSSLIEKLSDPLGFFLTR